MIFVMPEVFATDSDWKTVKIGGGGMATGIDVNSDGTLVTRTDGAGAFLWNGNEWIQLVTAYSMPAGTDVSVGVYEIRIAPSNSNIFYMETNGGVYKSVDRGTTWVKTAFPTVFMDANGVHRAEGQKMAIDPLNPNIVFAGTQENGLWVTRDGGTTWQQVTAVPQGGSNSDAGLSGIVFHNGTIYVGTAGSGVYRSTDGGYNWQSIPGGPSDVNHSAVSATGELFVTDTNTSALWKYAAGTWTKVIDSVAFGVAVDPFNPAHIVAVSSGGGLNESFDSGATWGGWNWYAQLEASDDVPWLETSGLYMSATDIVFDPITPNKLYQSAGVGVWNIVLTSPVAGATLHWNSQSAGIENIVPNDIIAPVGGNPIFASWDRAFFEVENLDSYATHYSGGDFSMGWSLDYASTDPSFIVGISDYWGREHSGYSTDGGQTWHEFAGLPSWALNTIGGSIAASTPLNFIWAASGNVPPAYTLDGGVTWTTITIPGLTDWSGFHHAYYLQKTTITADRVDAGTFYLYDVLSGVYVTHDGGVNWTKVFTGQISPWSYWNSKIEAVPGSEGELFFTTGNLDGDPLVAADIPFMHSTDGGATWQAVAGVKEVTTFGYGAAKVPGGPATIFIVGFVNEQYGIFYSTDDAQTWTQIGRYPAGNLDTITAISGDMDNYGMVYVGLGGKSYVYLDVDDIGTATPPANQPPPSGGGGGTPPVAPVTDTSDDFNGDGRSDILWQNDAGGLSNWLGTVNGSFVANDVNAATAVAANWRVADTGDFNGDGRSDILWRNLNGELSNWLGDADGGFTPNNSNAAVQVAVGWQVAGAGDFNGDGRDDILWRNVNGELSNWLGTAAGGFTPNNANAATMVAVAWQVVGTGDFNGDGRDDVLWRHSDGTVSDWLGTATGGFTPNNANSARFVPTAWHVVGTGDFNGDGRDDILWRNDNGMVSNWLGQADGGFLINDSVALHKVSPAWHVVGTGDYNGDGRDDILWRHVDGTVTNWLGTTNGGFVPNDDIAATNVANSWQVQAVDFWI